MSLQPAWPEESSLRSSIILARRLAEHAAALTDQFGLPELGDLTLPPISPTRADQAGMHAAAALYFASELESARLVPAMEALAGIYASGALAGDLGPAAAMVLGVWRHRRQHFTRSEREAFFNRLFGRPSDTSFPASGPNGAGNTEFEPAMVNLAEALCRLAGQPPGGPDAGVLARISVTARDLTENLAPRCRGMTIYAAGDIVGAIRAAIAIFSQPGVQAALGASALWEAVRKAARTYLNGDVDLEDHVARGEAGQAILAWLAETASRGGSLTLPTLDARSRAVTGGESWLRASLALATRQQAGSNR